MNKKKRLGDILIAAGKITVSQLEYALKSQRDSGKKLGEVLVDIGIINEEDIVNAIEEQTGIESVDLNDIEFERKAIKLVSKKLCDKYVLIPFGFEGSKIKVAFSDPSNIYAIDDISISTSLEVKLYVASKSEIKKFIEIHFSSQEVNRAVEELTKESLHNKALAKSNKPELEDVDEIKNSPIVKMVDNMFKNAVEMRTSDIHIEPFENEIRVRYRIDGQLKTVNVLAISSLAPLVTRIKILAGLNIAEKRIPQDGRIYTKVGNTEVDLRVSILPVVNGEKIVIRILNRKSYKVGKEKLGLSEENLKKLENMITTPHGIILVTGPTGSGKSTTLYTVLNELNDDSVNIVTVEDPVEYNLNGINQVNVNAKAGMTFPSALRSILRQDPDVVMIGEIRDDETAQIAVKAAITGHLVLSTLHTNDAPSSVTRLVDMGIESYLVATSIAGVIAQRLVRRICQNCRQPYEASEYEKSVLVGDSNAQLTLYKGKGCGHCNNSGYLGRIGVYEIMEISREHRDIISTTNDPNVLKDEAIKQGMSTLGNECKKLVLKGITTVDELATITLLKDL